MATKTKVPAAQPGALLKTLRDRFEANMGRHEEMRWETVQARLRESPEKLRPLQEMERTGGEPDVVVLNAKAKEIQFVDCAPESPSGRRSLCYDAAALAARKENKPKGSAQGLAAEMGVRLLKEEEYRRLQEFGAFDTKTSSWIQTPEKIRKLGGALFCDRRYEHVFVYHNGAESYYAVRGFRTLLVL